MSSRRRTSSSKRTSVTPTSRKVPVSSKSVVAQKKQTSVFLYVPNLIGYIRVCCTLYAVWSSFTCWQGFVISYTVGAVLDIADGYAARHWKQESRFGAVLDMVTDRVSTNMLYIVLAILYREYFFWICCLAGLDYASHWFHMYASAIDNGSHHKSIGGHRNWLLRKYYTIKPFMLACCVSQEAFLLAAYVVKNVAPSVVGDIALYVLWASVPFGALKQIINIIQLGDSSLEIVKIK
jgi:CDP-diacylglycerol--inositol 3-phosphatidyltransferase